MPPPSDDPDNSDSKKIALTNAELVVWARKRGVVTFFIFFSIAVAVAVGWYLTR